LLSLLMYSSGFFTRMMMIFTLLIFNSEKPAMSFHGMDWFFSCFWWIPFSSRISISWLRNNCFAITNIPNPENNTPEIPTILISKGFRRIGVSIFSASKIIQVPKTPKTMNTKKNKSAFFLLE